MRLSIAFQRGRWIGRKDATVAGARGFDDQRAGDALRTRAAELRGQMLEGFWFGVREIRPGWASRDQAGI